MVLLVKCERCSMRREESTWRLCLFSKSAWRKLVFVGATIDQSLTVVNTDIPSNSVMLSVTLLSCLWESNWLRVARSCSRTLSLTLWSCETCSTTSTPLDSCWNRLKSWDNTSVSGKPCKSGIWSCMYCIVLVRVESIWYYYAGMYNSRVIPSTCLIDRSGWLKGIVLISAVKCANTQRQTIECMGNFWMTCTKRYTIEEYDSTGEWLMIAWTIK
jgi:hypothetical protein